MDRHSRKISDLMLDKMSMKLSENNSHKVNTCWVASAIACGKQTARVIVASPEPFDASDAVLAIQATMQGSVSPYAPSFTPLRSEAEPNLNFASVHCYKSSHKIRPADEANMANCQAITASTYLDVELGNVWERTEIGQKQYLIRANEDDIEEAMAIAMTASVAPQARVDGNGFVIVPKVGDYVTFFATEQKENGVAPFIDVARVTEITGSSVGITIEEGDYHSSAFIPASSIVNVVIEANDAALQDKLSRSDIIEFLKECYGPEYAATLDTLRK